jgi:hypothetical protein
VSANKTGGRRAYLTAYFDKSSTADNATESESEQSNNKNNTIAPQSATTEKQEPVSTAILETVFTDNNDRKGRETVKATFELDVDLHQRLRMYAASRRHVKMVDVVEAALIKYLNDNE